jgi:hypothetical protein
MHQVDVIERAEQVEAEPPLGVDNGRGYPLKRGVIKGWLTRRVRAQVGKNGMEGDNDQDYKPAQIGERCTRARHPHITFLPAESRASSLRFNSLHKYRNGLRGPIDSGQWSTHRVGVVNPRTKVVVLVARDSGSDGRIRRGAEAE